MIATTMVTWGIYREPGPAARRRGRQDRPWWDSPRPKRVAVIEAPTDREALEAFARAEEIRSRQVVGWHVAMIPASPWERSEGYEDGGRLVVTLANGSRNVREAVYTARRSDGSR